MARWIVERIRCESVPCWIVERIRCESVPCWIVERIGCESVPCWIVERIGCESVPCWIVERIGCDPCRLLCGRVFVREFFVRDFCLIVRGLFLFLRDFFCLRVEI